MRSGDRGLFSRRAVATAGPIAAIFGASSNAWASPSLDEADAELLELGRRWIALCDKHDGAYGAAAGWSDCDPRHKEVDRATDLIHEEEMAVFDAATLIAARGLRGLVVKALMLARYHDCVGRDLVSMKTALDRAADLESTAALSLALDIARLAA